MQADGDYSRVHTYDRSYLCTASLGELEERLRPALRAHPPLVPREPGEGRRRAPRSTGPLPAAARRRRAHGARRRAPPVARSARAARPLELPQQLEELGRSSRRPGRRRARARSALRPRRPRRARATSSPSSAREAVEVGGVVAGVERPPQPASPRAAARTAVPLYASTGGSTSSTIRPQRVRSPEPRARGRDASSVARAASSSVGVAVVERDRERLPLRSGQAASRGERVGCAVAPVAARRVELEAVLADVATAPSTPTISRATLARPAGDARDERVAAGEPPQLGPRSRPGRARPRAASTIGASVAVDVEEERRGPGRLGS